MTYNKLFSHFSDTFIFFNNSYTNFRPKKVTLTPLSELYLGFEFNEEDHKYGFLNPEKYEK